MIHDITKVPPPRSVFKFNPELHFVKVENIPKDVDRQEILALFNALIGNVGTVEEQKNAAGGTVMQLSFQDRDAVKKALCMNGYTVSGTALIVTRGPSSEGQSTQSKYPDMRRNLYVLGLPFALTKSEFAAVFARYGTVAHCVILATVDNASRRRGFVVMSSHDEAKNAMLNLSRTQIKGHTLDISWAVVQRSQGFLDGGDRAIFMADSTDSRGPSATDDNEIDASDAKGSKPSATAFRSSDLSPLQRTDNLQSTLARRSPTQKFSPEQPAHEFSLIPTAIVLVSNLPSVLFSQPADLRPLLCPFGSIKNLQVFPSRSDGAALSGLDLGSQLSASLGNIPPPLLGITATTAASDASDKNKEQAPTTAEATTTVVVEYHDAADAEEAHKALKGQSYAQFALEARYLRPVAATECDSHPVRLGRFDGHLGRRDEYAGEQLEGHAMSRFSKGRSPSSPRLTSPAYLSSPYLSTPPYLPASPYLSSSPYLASSPYLPSSPYLSSSPYLPSSPYVQSSPYLSASPYLTSPSSHVPLAYIYPFANALSPSPLHSAVPSHHGTASSCNGMLPCSGMAPCLGGWHGAQTLYNAPHHMMAPHDAHGQLKHDMLSSHKHGLQSPLNQDVPSPRLPDTLSPRVPDTLSPRLPDLASSHNHELLSPRLSDLTSPRLPDSTSPRLPDMASTAQSATALPRDGLTPRQQDLTPGLDVGHDYFRRMPALPTQAGQFVFSA